MKTTEIKCDACGADLKYASNQVEYRLSLAPESKAHRGGFVTAMMLYPALEHEHHFCGLKCLDLWTDRRRRKDTLWAERHEEWKHEHGTAHESYVPGGKPMWSYPSMPQEVREKHAAEIEAIVAQEFP